MNVLMTADTVGGVWTYALDVAGALAAKGAGVHLATMGQLPDEGQRLAARRAPVAALHESGYRLEWEDDPWADVDAAAAWLLDLEEETRADVVQLNGYVHAALPWRAPVVVAAHSDVVSWWRAVEGTPVPAWLDEYRRRVAAGLEAADIVVAPTQAVLDDLSESFGWDGGGIVVPNGRAPFAPAGIAKEPLVVGLGRFWDAAKNVAALQRVAGRTVWPVEVAGPGTARGRVRPDEAAALLARASVYASPARYEPFGLTALEAAQAGCALVLGDIPSLREVWEDAALYVPPDDEDALVQTLDRLAGEDDLRDALAARARARARRYTPEATADRLLDAYASVLTGTAA